MNHKHNQMMALSGILALSFFLVANFTSIFIEIKVLAGIIQLILNAFVFVTWLAGYKRSVGFKKFVAAWGVAVPVIMAAITLFRVIFPALL